MNDTPFVKPKIKSKYLKITIIIVSPLIIGLMIMAAQINTKLPDPWVIFKVLVSSLGIVICGLALVICIILLIFGRRDQE